MPESGPVLIYDGTCGFCLRQVARLHRWLGPRLRALPCQSEAARELLPDLSADELASQVWVVIDHRRSGGAQAIVRAVNLRWPVRLLTWPYWLPGLRQLAEAVYRWVAANRYRFGGTCALRRDDG